MIIRISLVWFDNNNWQWRFNLNRWSKSTTPRPSASGENCSCTNCQTCSISRSCPSPSPTTSWNWTPHASAYPQACALHRKRVCTCRASWGTSPPWPPWTSRSWWLPFSWTWILSTMTGYRRNWSNSNNFYNDFY